MILIIRIAYYYALPCLVIASYCSHDGGGRRLRLAGALEDDMILDHLLLLVRKRAGDVFQLSKLGSVYSTSSASVNTAVRSTSEIVIIVSSRIPVQSVHIQAL